MPAPAAVKTFHDYIAQKTVDIISNEYSYARLLQLKFLLNIQRLLQKMFKELRLPRYE